MKKPGGQTENKTAGRQYVKTCVSFCLLAVCLNVIAYLLTREDYLFFINLFIANVSGALIRFSGLQALVNDNVIHLAHADWIVDTECTAINLIIIFISFIIAYPTKLKEKTLGILIGIPCIFVANFTRLLAMAWVDKLAPEYFPYFHNYFWQVIFLILIAFLWLLWLEKVVNRAPQNTVPA